MFSCEIVGVRWRLRPLGKMIVCGSSCDSVRSSPLILFCSGMSPVANQDTTLIDIPSSTPPTLKGYLNKYTNVARGYNTRWFVLKAGVFSCSWEATIIACSIIDSIYY